MSEIIDENKINEIMSHVMETLKPFDTQGVYTCPAESNTKYPEYYDGYNDICNQYEDILVHSKVGVFPSKLLGQRAPNMSEKEWDYVKNNYRSWTVPMFIDFLNSVKRAFNGGNYHINWPKEDDQTDARYTEQNAIRKYIEFGIDQYGSLENFFKYMYPSLRLQDVNGVIVVRPEDFIKTEDQNAELGFQFYEDAAELREPMPFYYDCRRVILPTQYFYLIELPEKCKIKVGAKTMNIGRVWELHTENEIYRIYQSGQYVKYTWTTKLLVQHNIGEIQCKRIGGLPELVDGKLHFVAEMAFAVPNLDLVLLNKSNLQIGNNNGVFPVRVMLGNECDFIDKVTSQKCNGGSLYNDDLKNPRTCPSCHGSGLKSRITPMGDFLIKPKTSEGEAEIKASDAIYSHSTDTTTLEFLLKCIDKDETRARNILHLKGDSNGAGENVVESASMSKANYAFIKPISDQIFNMWQWVLDQIGAWREGSAYKRIVVIAPNDFNILSEADQIAQIKDAVTAGMPAFIIRPMLYKFLNTLYYTEKDTQLVYTLIMEADDLLLLSDAQINAEQSKGLIGDWQILLHQSANNLISELVRDDPKFFAQPLQDQIDSLNELAKEKDAEIKAGSSQEATADANLSNLNG